MIIGQAISKVLVIGYGNTLRGDDGVGPRIAEQIAALNWPSVESRALPQLVPELAEPLAAADLAIFVDARMGSSESGVEMTLLTEKAPNGPSTHGSDPGALLALARALYGQAPTAWLVTIAGEDFSLNASLSSRVERDAAAALDRIESLCKNIGEMEAEPCTKSA